MNFVKNITQIFNGKPKVFLVDDNKQQLEESLKVVKSTDKDTDVEGFTDCNKLLYILQSTKKGKYSFGIIHENGSKYKPQMLMNFIKLIDPTIQLFIYKNNNELLELAESI